MMPQTHCYQLAQKETNFYYWWEQWWALREEGKRDTPQGCGTGNERLYSRIFNKNDVGNELSMAFWRGLILLTWRFFLCYMLWWVECRSWESSVAPRGGFEEHGNLDGRGKKWWVWALHEGGRKKRPSRPPWAGTDLVPWGICRWWTRR